MPKRPYNVIGGGLRLYSTVFNYINKLLISLATIADDGAAKGIYYPSILAILI